LLTTSGSLDEHVQQLSAMLAGPPDSVLKREREFVHAFVRPCGLDVRATDVMVDAVETLARLAPGKATEHRGAIGVFGLTALRALERIPLGRRLLLNQREVEAKQRRADTEGREVSWL